MKPVLEAKGLEKTYGRQVVFRDLSFVISEGAHIALIGRNGSGKTTLLKILTGEEERDAGSVQLMPWTRLGVLRQHQVLPSDQTTLAFLEAASNKPEWTCSKLAARFGLGANELELPPTALSGGYQMRVKLVAMLLTDPNLLLLDEPLNYLDLPTMLLFEAFLRDYKGALMMTSHDREILQNICDSTWEIERGDLTTFPGDVETYLDWKQEQVMYAERTNKRLRKEMASAQAFVDRFRAKASLATRAQSKLKHIAKLRTKLQELGEALPTAAFRITCPAVTDGTAVRCKELTIGYNDRAVATGIDLEILRGSKVAIVGENGQGKSTLLKTLAGILPPLAGEAKWWHRADVGYFSQMSEDTLDLTQTVLSALTSAAPPDASGERILAAAGAFLFKEDDLEKPCSVLSGGERARLRLARLVLQEHNVLLLDEPTNHLDAETVDVLASALKAYPGTVILVSHARTFVNAVANTLFEVHGGRVRRYLGTYEEYVADLTAMAQDTAGSAESATATPSATIDKRAQRLIERERKRAQEKREANMKILDREKSEILAYFFENPTDYAPEKSIRLAEIDEEMMNLEREWLDQAYSS